MDEDNDNDLLRKTYALVKENNRLLRKARRGSWYGLFFKLLFWGVMIGIPAWLYFTVLQPILQQGMGVLEQVQNVAGQVQNATDGAGIQTGQVKSLLKTINSIPGLDVLKQIGEQ